MDNNAKKTLSVRSRDGMTMIEMIITLSLMAIIASMALPSYLSWRQSLEYRKVARSIAVHLKETRSQAITTNVAQQMSFDVVNRRYSAVNAGWITYPAEVSLAAVTVTFTFNTNGTANAGWIDVRDAAGTVRYKVDIAATGKVSITP